MLTALWKKISLFISIDDRHSLDKRFLLNLISLGDALLSRPLHSSLNEVFYEVVSQVS